MLKYDLELLLELLIHCDGLGEGGPQLLFLIARGKHDLTLGRQGGGQVFKECVVVLSRQMS